MVKNPIVKDIHWSAAHFFASDKNYGFDVKLREESLGEEEEWDWRVYDGSLDDYTHFGTSKTAAGAKADCLKAVRGGSDGEV